MQQPWQTLNDALYIYLNINFKFRAPFQMAKKVDLVTVQGIKVLFAIFYMNLNIWLV